MVTAKIRALLTIALAMVISSFASHIIGDCVVPNRASSVIRSGISTGVTYITKLLRNLLGFNAPYTRPGLDVKLPPDLRLRIYGYLLQSDVRLKRLGHPTTDADILVDTSILAINELIRHEATPVFYENNTFHLNLAYIAYVKHCGRASAVHLRTQELGQYYKDIHISCNATIYWQSLTDTDRSLCIIRVMRYLLETRGERPKLRSLLLQMGKQNTNLMDEVTKSFPGTEFVCTTVGRWDLTPPFAGITDFRLEYSAMAAVFGYYHALHPNDTRLLFEDTTISQQLERFAPKELDLVTRVVKSRLGPARVGWYLGTPNKEEFHIMTIREKSECLEDYL